MILKHETHNYYQKEFDIQDNGVYLKSVEKAKALRFGQMDQGMMDIGKMTKQMVLAD